MGGLNAVIVELVSVKKLFECSKSLTCHPNLSCRVLKEIHKGVIPNCPLRPGVLTHLQGWDTRPGSTRGGPATFVGERLQNKRAVHGFCRLSASASSAPPVAGPHPDAPLQPADRAYLWALGQALHHVPWHAASPGDGRRGGNGLPVLARRGAKRRGGDAKPGAFGDSLPVPGSAERRAAVAGRCSSGEEASAVA